MNFGEALQALKESRKVKREKWEGFIFLATNGNVKDHIGVIINNTNPNLSWNGMQAMQLNSEDVLSDDWQIIE